jgi:hypothetical protein
MCDEYCQTLEELAMNTESSISNDLSPPPEKPTEATNNETTHTDPGPVMDEPIDQRDWSDAEDRYEMIAEAAYYKAEQRGFELGNEELDWLEAEQELLEKMTEETVY